jgi:nitrate/TMAO reductase-like tetraheme cytochrome c subunit
MSENEPLSEQPRPPETAEQPKPRKRRLRRRWIALIVVAAAIVVLVIAAFITAHFTSRSSFCDSCHEMKPYYASWQTSSHATAECRDCHIPPGFVAYVQTKLFSFREIWVHITNGAEAPLAVTREIPNGSCLRCHRNGPGATPGDVTLGNASFSHQAHQGQLCITCHLRLVHRDVNPPYYKSPAAMSSCLECHNGTTAPSQCSTCHTPGHEPRGECSDCHNTESWGAGGTQHPFPRTGGHAGLACTDCHVSKPGSQIIPGTDLPRPDPACISCHGDEHKGLTDCTSCHTVAGWKPANFTHPQVGEHVPSGERQLDCVDCHPDGYGTYSCLKCHDTNAGGGGD